MNDPKHHNTPQIQPTAPSALFPAHHIAAQQLCHAIERFWPDSAYIREFVHPHSRRRIDLLAIDPYSHTLTAYEIKNNAPDFLQELQNPAKAAPFLNLVHYFYFVSPDQVVCPALIPSQAGYIKALNSPQGITLTIVIPAPKLTPPGPTWRLLSQIARRIHNPIPSTRPLPQQPLQAQIRQLARSQP